MKICGLHFMALDVRLRADLLLGIYNFFFFRSAPYFFTYYDDDYSSLTELMLELGASVSEPGWMKTGEIMLFGTPLDLICQLKSSRCLFLQHVSNNTLTGRIFYQFGK